MSEVINVTVSAKVKNGPSITFSNSLKIDAYDKFNVSVASGATKTIQILPSGTTAVLFLLITSSQYSNDTDKISYKVNGAGSPINVDTPQNFIGEGSLSALDDSKVPETLEFTNDLTDDVDIQILVGRNAVT